MKRTRRHRLLKHGNCQITISPKTGKKTGKSTGNRKKKVGGFLNRYEFADAGRDVENQVEKDAPGIIKSDINKIAQQRIDQAIKTGGPEVERIAPKI